MSAAVEITFTTPATLTQDAARRFWYHGSRFKAVGPRTYEVAFDTFRSLTDLEVGIGAAIGLVRQVTGDVGFDPDRVIIVKVGAELGEESE